MPVCIVVLNNRGTHLGAKHETRARCPPMGGNEPPCHVQMLCVKEIAPISIPQGKELDIVYILLT